MKRNICILIIAVATILASCSKKYETKPYNEGINIIPVPKEMSVDETKHFVVRNSWGEHFGDKGYCYIPYSYICDSDLNRMAC
ncbi:MAG: hypothetical protein II394_00045, partial [Bacteroidales bacterium]|nr:hypothetical protein [Bacteroidales bacterium]